jgi:SAM-dependent methyltransferase
MIGGSSSRRQSRRWMSYDTVAGVYHRVAVPWFTPMAHDLIDAVAPVPGEKVLDLGTGTGLVAKLASVAVAPDGWVVGVDPSTEMLARGDPTRSVTAVAGVAPGLPFADAVFDVVVANLVLSHFPDLHAGLEEVVRVMHQGSRLGCTAWASPVRAAPGNEWPEADEIVAAAKRQCGLDLPPPTEEAVPFEDQLRDRDQLVGVLADARVVDLTAELHRYQHSFAVAEFLSGWGSQSRYLRQVAGEQRWQNFVRSAAESLHDRFGDTISCVNEAWIVVGRTR